MEPNGLLELCFRSLNDEKKKSFNKEMSDINIIHDSEISKKKVKLPDSLIGSSKDRIHIINDSSDSEDSERPKVHKTKLNHEDFNSFTNPSKKIIGEPENYSDDESETDNSMSGSSDDSGMTEDSSEENYETANQERLLKKQQKYDILSKLQQLERRGVTLSKKFSMKSKLHDLQFELKRVTDILDKESGLKFSRKVLMAAVTGIEYANKRFDPVQAKLDGWSEHIMSTLGDYDGCFLRLYDKYKDSAGNVSPEIELLLLLGGSATMFHITKSFVAQRVPKFTEVAKESPELASKIAHIMAKKYDQEKKEKKTDDISDSDDDDIESVNTQTFESMSGNNRDYSIPTDMLSTPAFPALIEKMIHPTNPRPKFNLQDKKKLEPVDEEPPPLKEKSENVLVIS